MSINPKNNYDVRIALKIMSNKNPNILKLIDKFDLEYLDRETGEFYSTNDLLNIKKFKTMAKTKKNFKEEIEATTVREFYKFEDELGDSFTGTLKAKEMIDFKDGKGEKQCFVIEDEDGNEFLAPTNQQLTNKLNNLWNSKNETECDVYIEFTGLEKLGNSTNKSKTFKVLTT